MSHKHLNACLEREQLHSHARFWLDDELGTQHGLSWADFVLLEQLETEPVGVAEAQLAKELSLPRSRLLLQTRPLEKLGLVLRTKDATRSIRSTPAGRRLLREARDTAEMVCARLASTPRVGKTQVHDPELVPGTGVEPVRPLSRSGGF